ncbi:LysR substrate-binding domain-containing protein [Kordiimonas pumila]|uniref:LysR substrate-binding domain-containing protein n=1 Tax=Kordiimonas pumila TaxID=2161677 RepID=A0ABV7D6J3_9PROT|nr:LysR substrate-binding domain-containing protein [Kordiimonas pumila]
MFDPVWLKSFITVAETLSFTAAAKRLNLRQSTVSEHVRKLEHACDRRFFVRDTHSVKITKDGEAMVGFAASILEVNARAHSHFSDNDIQGRIRLGVSEDVVLSGLPHALRRFTLEHPQVELELTVGVSVSLREQLTLGSLDLVFLKRNPGEIYGDLVWREPLVWIAAPHFRLDRDRPVPLIALAPPALTRATALAVLEQHGQRWQLVCSSSSQSGVHAATLAGLGVAPHARSLVPSGLVEIMDESLPALGDTEFVLIGGHAARKGPALALAEMIRTSGALLRNREVLRAYS